ncbi:MAG: hypothetical protein RIB59_09920 [Rhodospirillales bacterium]
MLLSKEQVREMAKAVNLDIPEAEIDAVIFRLSGFLTAMEDIERDLGEELTEVDPIPPVYPREEF